MVYLSTSLLMLQLDYMILLVHQQFLVRFYIIWSTIEVMPEQQKIDETVETTKSLNKKKLSKIEQSSTSLENQQNSAPEVSSEDIDNNTNSILETQDDEIKT